MPPTMISSSRPAMPDAILLPIARRGPPKGEGGRPRTACGSTSPSSAGASKLWRPEERNCSFRRKTAQIFSCTIALPPALTHTSRSRRLPIPGPALEGATSYWASVETNPPGHISTRGASSTEAKPVAPGGPARPIRLQQAPTRHFPGTGTIPFHPTNNHLDAVISAQHLKMESTSHA